MCWHIHIPLILTFHHKKGILRHRKAWLAIFIHICPYFGSPKRYIPERTVSLKLSNETFSIIFAIIVEFNFYQKLCSTFVAPDFVHQPLLSKLNKSGWGSNHFCSYAKMDKNG